MNRNELILSMFDARRGVGLEIGPSFNPLIPRKHGYQVDIVDHLSAQGLKEKYKSANVDLTAIEDVDYIADGRALVDLIGKSDHYHHCVASHVIEHTVDMIGFLQDCQKLLREDGVLVLAVPDKRYSFDAFRPPTTSGMLIDAHCSQDKKRHSLGRVFDELAYSCTRGGQIAWPSDHVGDYQFFRSADDALRIYQAYASSDQFIDVHAWQFTPSSFRLIIHDLNLLGLIGLKEDQFFEGSGEFFMTLGVHAKGCPQDRLTLALQAARELK